MNDEAYVRSVWASVSYCSREETNSCCGPSVFIGPFTGKWVGEFRAETKSRVFELAAEFTREHKEKVRQLREEIARATIAQSSSILRLTAEMVPYEEDGTTHEADIAAQCEHVLRWTKRVCAESRTRARLESALATLTQGMKPDVQP